jgi:peptide/nickel transport system substrate-binding protein
VLKLVRGEVDMLQGDLPPELVKYLSQQTDIAVHSVAGANFSYIGFNMQDALLSKPEVRLAIAHAIDTPAIIKQVLVAESRQAGAILPPEHWAGNAKLAPYDYNPKLARELLLKAGIQLPKRKCSQQA